MMAGMLLAVILYIPIYKQMYALADTRDTAVTSEQALNISRTSGAETLQLGAAQSGTSIGWPCWSRTVTVGAIDSPTVVVTTSSGRGRTEWSRRAPSVDPNVPVPTMTSGSDQAVPRHPTMIA